jgi:hypothetical protein
MMKSTLNKLTTSLLTGAFCVSTLFAPLPLKAEVCLDYSGATSNTTMQGVGTAEYDDFNHMVRATVWGNDLNNNTNTVWKIYSIVQFYSPSIPPVTETFYVTNKSAAYSTLWYYKCDTGNQHPAKDVYAEITRVSTGKKVYAYWSYKE